jgi:hypothetical protein
MATAHARTVPSTDVEVVFPGELMTIEEAINRYPCESILMRVLDEDAQHLPIKGYVLAHSSDDQAIEALADREPLKSLLAEKNPTDGYYSFWTRASWFAKAETASKNIRMYSEYIREQGQRRAARRR